MYITNFTLPSFNEEFAVLYHHDGPMLGQMKRNSGNIYPFNIFPERIERMGSLSIDFTTPITILYGNNGSGKTTILNLIAEHLNAARHSAFNKSVKGKVDFPQIGFKKGTTERGFSKVSKSV